MGVFGYFGIPSNPSIAATGRASKGAVDPDQMRKNAEQMRYMTGSNLIYIPQ